MASSNIISALPFQDLAAELRNKVYEQSVPSEITVIVRKRIVGPGSDRLEHFVLPSPQDKAVQAQGVTIVLDAGAPESLIVNDKAIDEKVPVALYRNCHKVKMRMPVSILDHHQWRLAPGLQKPLVGHLTVSFVRQDPFTPGMRGFWEFDEYRFDTVDPKPETSFGGGPVLEAGMIEHGVPQLKHYVAVFGQQALRNHDLSDRVLVDLKTRTQYDVGLEFSPRPIFGDIGPWSQQWKLESFETAVYKYQRLLRSR